MRRFRLLFVAIVAALVVPTALLVHRAVRSVTLEQQLRHQAVAERIFDEMERALSALLEREEARPFGEYGAGIDVHDQPFIVGHFQVDPDGAVHTPPSLREPAAIDAVTRVVRNHWRGGPAEAKVKEVAAQAPGTTVAVGAGGRQDAVAPEVKKEQESHSSTLSAFDALRSLNKTAMERSNRFRLADEGAVKGSLDTRGKDAPARAAAAPGQTRDALLDAELPPLRARVISAQHLVVYRSIVQEARVYRQGLLVDVGRLATWLREQALGNNGLATYATVSFSHPFAPPAPAGAGESLAYQHRFAEPFDDLGARLALRPLPGVGSAAYVYMLSALLVGVGTLGMAALYRMVSVTVSFAERRSNFVAAVSHELKTPLTAIRMYAEMLRDGMVTSDEKRAEYYRHLTVESERLSRLINNVLEFSRLEKGTRQMALATAPIGPVVHDAAALLRPLVEGEGFELRVDVASDLPAVRFERDALMQVLFNLADNAVKYARATLPRAIELHATRDGDTVRLSLRDHGPGVPSRHLPRIFEPFYRGEDELTRRNKGAGLGLALVRDLVERMGGAVHGRNAPDGGFVVEVVLPIPRP